MSQLSPYARSTSERSQNRHATSLFVAVVAVVFFAVPWLIDSNRLPKPPPSVPPSKSPVTTESKPEANRPEVEGTDPVDWSARIAAIEQELPDSNDAELIALKQRLQGVDRILNEVKLSVDDEASFQLELDKLQQHAAKFNAESKRPAVNAVGFPEQLSSIAQSILMAEQEAVRQAREQAEGEVRKKKEPAIRKVRLEVRDEQDTATDLRRQIAQMQREQKEFQAKTARAEALQRQNSDVERYLQPFTAPGYLQPNSDSNPWDIERTADAKPVSLTRLKRVGALEDTMEGLERLYIFGGGKNPTVNNRRPLGLFPEYWAQKLSKPDILQAVKRAQQLLRDHGQALVEQQKLSP